MKNPRPPEGKEVPKQGKEKKSVRFVVKKIGGKGVGPSRGLFGQGLTTILIFLIYTTG